MFFFFLHNTHLHTFFRFNRPFFELTGTMSSEQPPAKCRKISAYINIHSTVNSLYRSIRSIKDNHLTDEQARDFGIEFSRLDLNNAEMAESESAHYFLPADPDEFNIAAAGVKFDEFTGFPSDWIKELLGRFNCLVGAYLDYESALWNKYRPPSETVMYVHFLDLLILFFLFHFTNTDILACSQVCWAQSRRLWDYLPWHCGHRSRGCDGVHRREKVASCYHIVKHETSG